MQDGLALAGRMVTDDMVVVVASLHAENSERYDCMPVIHKALTYDRRLHFRCSHGDKSHLNIRKYTV